MKLRKSIFVVFGILALCAGAWCDTFTVVDAGDAPTGKTLRAAILAANANAGPDTIDFDLGTITLSPATELPALSDTTGGTTIDGGGRITLSGSGAGTDVSGLILESNSNIITNLCIISFDMAGVVIYGNENQVTGCLLGLSYTKAAGNTYGVAVMGNNNILGGENREDGNVISGNSEAGVIMGKGAAGNRVQNNLIGTDVTGVTAVPNDTGVYIEGGTNNHIGGLLKGEGNIISGNIGEGVVVNEDTSEDNFIQGNRIGLNKNGEVLGNGGDGIFIGAALYTLIGGDFSYGNRISGNNGNGIYVQKTASGTTIQGNVIGMDGSEPKSKIPEFANRLNGIQLDAAEDIVIGGAGGELGEGNIISANVLNGIYLCNECANVTLYANKIGVTADGLDGIGNGGSGIYIDNSSGTIAGWMAGLPDRRNIISGNGDDGVAILGSASIGNHVVGCYIGTNATGTAAIPNGMSGVRIEGAVNNTIGGAFETGHGNLISGNNDHGVLLNMPGTTGNTILGNRIGVNADATAAIPNAQSGVVINEAPGNTVGGGWYSDQNIISGNTYYGVLLLGTNCRNTQVLNNLIGTNAAQEAAIPNFTGVIMLAGAHDNHIGGPGKGEGNVLSGNTISGIIIQDTGTMANTVQGNFIGVTQGGVTPVSPGTYGMQILNHASNNSIGGSEDAANIIAHATQAGIYLDPTTELNAIRYNSIYANGGKGIEIPSGGNQGIQPPVIQALAPVSGTGPVNSHIDIFADDEDEGRIYLASVFSSATGEFSSPVDLAGYSGMYVTATATDLTGNSSEFSAAVLIPGEGEEEGSAEGEGMTEGSEEGSVEGSGEGEGEEPEGEPGMCPGSVVYAQTPSPPTGSWGAWNNDEHLTQRIYENVTGVSGTIQSISWWGFGGHYVKEKGLESCYRDVDTFSVQVYVDNGGEPGSFMYGAAVTPEKAFTGWYYDMSFGQWPLYHYHAILSSPLVLANEAIWISISGLGDTDCFFYWLSSPYGDGAALAWDGSSYEPTVLDTSLCLNAGSETEGEGTAEGTGEGVSEGGAEGLPEGLPEGIEEGISEGQIEGEMEGQAEGSAEGAPEGLSEGQPEGLLEGILEGAEEGVVEGAAEGVVEGTIEGQPEGDGEGSIVEMFHSADQDGDNLISLSELLRVIQFFNSDGYHCDAAGEDGFNPGQGDTSCVPHASDYNLQDWYINLSELLRIIQFFNSGGYHACPAEGTEDGYCPGPA